jgi:hypothetical protein
MQDDFDPSEYLCEIQDLVRSQFGTKWVQISQEE